MRSLQLSLLAVLALSVVAVGAAVTQPPAEAPAAIEEAFHPGADACPSGPQFSSVGAPAGACASGPQTLEEADLPQGVRGSCLDCSPCWSNSDCTGPLNNGRCYAHCP